MQARGGAFILIAVGLLLCAIGYGVGHYLGLPVLQHAKSSVNWPSVPGKITSSRVEKTMKRDSKKHTTTTTYRARVEYTYEIEGYSRTGNVVWFGDDYSSSSLSSHQGVVDRYPAGKAINVHYDPAHPELCVLEPGAKFSSYVIYGIGWFLLGLGGILVLGGMKSFVFPF